MSTSSFALELVPGALTLDALRRVYREPVRIRLADAALGDVERARRAVDAALVAGEVVYGINTGFGRLAQTRIGSDELEALQRNLLLSHATGVGELLDDAVVRLAMVLKVNALARGASGVRRELVVLLAACVDAQLWPAVPGKGSVGASGDLAPLAHLALALVGEGEVRVDGALTPSAEALAGAGLEPIVLAPKEGLALLNGTQISTALALAGLFDAERSADAAFLAGALTVEAALGSRVPFDEEIHRLRGQPGQIEAAAIYRRLLDDSEINRSHAECDKVQDPYSLRCQPQVMGACLDQMRAAARTLEIEANAVSDNPLVLADGRVVSGGNFHGEPVAMAADNLALAIAEMGALAERRIALLMDSALSLLPPFLVEDAGLNSGFMIAQVTSAALASENKSLAHPASVDSLPTSANQEDHVSMSAYAARRLAQMNENTRYVIAIELLAAAQGIDLRRPLTSNDTLERAHATIRRAAAYWGQDRYFRPDLEAVAALIRAGDLGSLVRL